MSKRRKTPRPQSDRSLRLIGYCRVSTDDQARNGLSMEVQRKRLKAHATAIGYELVGVKADNGTSGKVAPMKRAGMRQALEAIGRGEADGLVAVKLDRFSRSTRHILDLADDAKRGGWHLVSLQENIDTNTACGRMILTVLAALSEMEREQVSERTKAIMDDIARQGRGRSRHIPFGYRIKGAPDATTLTAGDLRPLVKHAGEQKLLRRMKRLRGQGYGTHRVAGYLNGRGIENPRGGGKPWTRSSVHSILATADKRAGS